MIYCNIEIYLPYKNLSFNSSINVQGRVTKAQSASNCFPSHPRHSNITHKPSER